MYTSKSSERERERLGHLERKTSVKVREKSICGERSELQLLDVNVTTAARSVCKQRSE
jgi:hypothetical protein